MRMIPEVKLPEWKNEPDELDWVDDKTGYACHMKRNGMGAWCGYVRVPPGHDLDGKCYSERVSIETYKNLKVSETASPIAIFCHALGEDDGMISLEIASNVHGGLTYSGELGNEGEHWFGFDCSHAGDACPNGCWRDGDVYRNVEYVKAECTKLASFIASFGLDKVA